MPAHGRQVPHCGPGGAVPKVMWQRNTALLHGNMVLRLTDLWRCVCGEARGAAACLLCASWASLSSWSICFLHNTGVPLTAEGKKHFENAKWRQYTWEQTKQKRCLSWAAVPHREAMSDSTWRRNHQSVWSVQKEHFGGLSILSCLSM